MANKKWFQIRRELFKHLETQVRHRLGPEPLDLQKYRKKYEKEFLGSWRVGTREDLLEALRNSEMILMGDFHALHQSQKAQLRLLKELAESKVRVHLMLECFEAKDQKLVDKFLSGALSDKEFLHKVRWEERWGFPFEYYRPILKLAQKKKWQVSGVNLWLSKRSQKTLLARDKFSAQIIEQRWNRGDERAFIIYGDLHLAKEHLVHFLKKKFVKLNVIRVFQNPESLYLRQLSRDPSFSEDVMRKGKFDFCLLNVPPWVKYQNYLMYLEETYDFELDEDLDFTEHVAKYVKVICEDLKLNISLDLLSVYSNQDDLFWSKIEDSFALKEVKIFEKMIEESKSFYVPEIQAGYLARLSVNHAATLAMDYIHAQVSARQKSNILGPNDFKKMIWQEGLRYFGSKLINPKRKTETLTDLKSIQQGNGDKQLVREAVNLALSQKLAELMEIAGRSYPLAVKKIKNKWSYNLAAEYLGGILGERLFEGYRRKLLSEEQFLVFLNKNVDDPMFGLVYNEMLEIIESVPLSFKSKRERL
ncbi:MAG: ChaN family lipoprotein [Bdellovibrionia bacterium]